MVFRRSFHPPEIPVGRPSSPPEILFGRSSSPPESSPPEIPFRRSLVPKASTFCFSTSKRKISARLSIFRRRPRTGHSQGGGPLASRPPSHIMYRGVVPDRYSMLCPLGSDTERTGCFITAMPRFPRVSTPPRRPVGESRRSLSPRGGSPDVTGPGRHRPTRG